MSEDSGDDLQWFELMAGRGAPEARASTRADATWMRAAMLSFAPLPPPGQMPPADLRATRLIARALAAGVLRPTAVARWPKALHVLQALQWPQWGWRGLGASAVAALMLTIVLRVDDPQRSAVQIDAERGAAVQQIVATEPRLRQQEVLRTLRAVGLDARPYEQPGRLGVDVELKQPLSQAQQAALRSLGLKIPTGPGLLIEIIAP